MNRPLSGRTFVLSMFLLLAAGLGFALVLYRLTNPPNRSKEELRFFPVTSKPTSLTLNLPSPEDNLLAFEPALLVQGKTSPQAFVLLSLPQEDFLLETDNEGNFTTTVSLQTGLNQLMVVVFDKSGRSKSESRTIYYSPEEI